MLTLLLLLSIFEWVRNADAIGSQLEYKSLSRIHMFSHFMDWINLIVRWFHLVAGISWIGNSFYFMWLDGHLGKPSPPKEHVEGDLWMVHSGGFYQVEKRKIQPGQMPKILYWFRWEATFTWISGFFLLGLVYYMSHGAYLLDPAVSSISFPAATGLGLGFLVVSWIIYDSIWRSPIGKNSLVGSILSLLLVLGASYGLSRVFSGRGMFIHIGSMFGTIMISNVWMHILPSQKKMIEATEKGTLADFNLGKHAKRRSTHNSYMTLPVLFIMISNHYPSTYGNEYNWVILSLLILTGGFIRHFMIHRNPRPSWIFAPVVGCLVALFLLTFPKSSDAGQSKKSSFASIQSIIQKRCVSCHSSSPEDSTFGPMPGGISLDTPDKIQKASERILNRAVSTKTMPLGNKTGMTDDEREQLKTWIDQGANIQ